MKVAATSVRMCPASASSEIEPVSSAVVSSTTKNAPSSAVAIASLGTGVPAFACSWPAPMANNICNITHILQDRRRLGSEPGAPELGQMHAGICPHRRHTRELVEPVDDPEKPLVDPRGEKQEKQEQDAVGLELFQRALGLRAQMWFQRVVTVQAGDRQ